MVICLYGTAERGAHVFQAILLSGVMTVVTTAIHLTGLTVLMMWVRQHRADVETPGKWLSLFLFILFVVIGVVLVHVVEIFAFALVYMAIGEIGSLETAVYFSASNFTTLGLGDIVLDSHWRLVVAMEGLVGFLIGVGVASVLAFVLHRTGRLRLGGSQPYVAVSDGAAPGADLEFSKL